ncbi:reverse transcriptase, partial [Globisporangium splendens]
MRTRTQGERTLTANPLNWRSDTVPAARPDRNERVLTARPSRWRSATTPTTPTTTEAINETLATTTTTQAITPEAPDDGRPWLLRFDGACPGNPGKGGAGSALYEPGGAILWTCHHFLPENFNTNNTAEYTALLDGVQAAKRHGARRLRVEGDSILVIRQVRGIYACGNKRLRALRNRILGCLRSLDSFELHHIDRKANTQADALANRALDHAATKSVCAVHGAGDDRCWTPIQRKTTSQRPDPEATVDEEMKETSDDDEEEVVRRDEGEVYAPVRLEPGTIPAKRPRLQLRALSENEDEKSRAIIERFAKKMATKITDCEDWETGEGYITALTMQMYDLLQEYSTTKKPRSMMKTKKKTTATKTMMRPPRPSTQHREARLEEALDDLIIAQRAEPSQQGRIQKARRRVGRVKVAILRSKLRLKFEQKEKECVQELLRGVNEDVTEGPMEDTTCPIGREDLYAFFQGVNTPNMVFDFDSDVGAPFRAVLQRLPPPEQVREALTDDLTIDEIEDQLQIVNGASSPGLDGIGHDVYKHFRLQLLPALHAAFSFCWKHRKVPTAWKVGTVRLLYKKGDPNQPSNWRPICLQQCIYKLYSGILAKRFTRWMDTNERFSLAQKGFRAFNGCHEHNFLSTSLLDQTRRMHRKLYNVWYDLKNAFGSLPQELMWRVLGMLRVDAAFIERAQNIYEDSHFVVNNAHDGPTDPIRQEIGVYQGCPLSPYLFIAALIPLLRGLQELPGVGVPLAENFRPCVSAYADDIKIFSDSASGIRSAHQLVERFLKWTTMRANPSKCALLAVTTNSRGNPELDTELQLHLDGTPIPRLTLSDSYAYLGIGDGFDHIQRRFALVPKLGELKKNVVALLRSPLAPWQILKAVKTYIYPQVEYALRHLRPLHSQLQGFDRVLSKGLRHLLRLPSSATTAFMYAPTSHGGLGLLPLTELHAALQIAHGWQMLHSKDHTIQAVARTQITQIIRKRYRLDEEYWKERTEEAIQRFLNSDLDSSLTNIRKRRNGDIGSLWTDIQRHLATHQLRLADVVDPSSGERQWLQLKTPSSRDWLEHTTVLRQVKLHMKNAHLNRWKEMSDQGRTVRAQGGPGSSFLTRGTCMWDNDYVFAVQARLNQLDTRSVLKRKRVRTNATCRYAECRSTETLAHVLNHCPGTSDAVTKRHDSALKLITDTLQPRVLRSQERLQLRVNQTVEGMAGQLRPDLQLFDTRSKTVVVADLAITYEDHQQDGPEFSSLAASAQRKIEKYQPIKAHLMQQGWTVHLSALVYGSLGSVLPGNFKVYTEELGLLKKDARRLNTTISTEAIKASRRIWNLHCALHRGPTRRVETQATTHPDPVQIQTPDRRLQASPAQLQHDPAPERRPQPTDTRAPAPEQRKRRVRITAPAPEQQQGDRPATNSAPDERQRHQTLQHRHPAPPGRQPELQHRLPPVRNQPNQPRHRRPTLRGGAPVHRAPATETTRPTPELQRGQPSGTGTQVRRSTLSTSIAGTAAGPRSAPAPTRGGTDGEARRPTPPARAGRSTSDPTATRRPRSAFSATAGAPATRQPRRAYSATAGTPATRPARRAYSATAGTPATRPARRTFSATAGTPEAPTRGPGGPTGTNQSVLERMRFFWPLRDRSPSTDSECSTASQSSLASDASFYSAAGGEEMSTAPSRPADPIVDLRGDPPADPLGDPPEDPLGDQPPMPCFTFGAGWEPQDPLRVAAGGASFPGPQPPPGAATSGTGAQPAAPIAPQRAAARTTSGRNDRIAPSSAPQLVFDIEAPASSPDASRSPPDRAATLARSADSPADRRRLPPDCAPPALPDPPCARPERGESLADGRAPDLATERDEIPAPAPPSSPRELLQPLNGSSQDVALAVYAHNAALFECTLCAHTARDLAALQQHRRSAHRNTRFVDHFHSGCACGVSFFSRAAATKHARECPESAFSAAAAARTAAANTAGMSLGADERDDLASAGVLHDVASPAFGSILPAALATAADAPSATATADAATQQSTVPPAAAQPPRRAHVPPVPRALSPPSALRIGGKRRRLNGDDDDSGGDLDVLMHDEDIAAHVEALPEPHHNGAAAPSARERGAPSAPHSHTLGPSTPPRPPACSKHGELEPAAGGRGGGRSDSAERERNSSSDSDDRANAPTTTQTTDTSDERGNRDNHDDTRTDAEYDNKHQRRADAPTTPRTIESGDNNDERADCEHERDDGDTCDDDTRDTCERDNDSNDSNQGTGSDGNSDGHSSDGDTIGRNLDPAI